MNSSSADKIGIRFMRAGLLHRKTLIKRLSSGMFLLVLAVVTFAQAPALPPASIEKFQQASEAMRNGNLDAAGEGFAAVVKEAPTFAEGYLNLGLVREEQGKHTEAIGDFQKALQLKPKLRGANLFLGIAQYRDYTARNLSYGHQRRLEIARALATDPQLLALDRSVAVCRPWLLLTQTKVALQRFDITRRMFLAGFSTRHMMKML